MHENLHPGFFITNESLYVQYPLQLQTPLLSVLHNKPMPYNKSYKAYGKL